MMDFAPFTLDVLRATVHTGMERDLSVQVKGETELLITLSKLINPDSCEPALLSLSDAVQKHVHYTFVFVGLREEIAALFIHHSYLSITPMQCTEQAGVHLAVVSGSLDLWVRLIESETTPQLNLLLYKLYQWFSHQGYRSIFSVAPQRRKNQILLEKKQ